ncbi:MAG: methionyl-tRNA formyltransferase [Parvularculaceae bacterium]
MPFRLAFMGTPEIAAICLRAILDAGHDVAAVYTQPPRPAGRGKALRPSPVQILAEREGLELRAPKSLRSKDAQEAFAALAPDIAVVVAYGLILPQPVLDAPRNGCVNLHASLLPRWRGAAPIQRAIMAGDDKTGVQVMQMEAGLDTGPVLMSAETEINPRDTAGTLHDRLARMGAALLPKALSAIEAGTISPIPQSENGACYAHKIDKAEARIDWTRPAEIVDRQIRGLSPFPGAWFEAPSPKGPVRIKALMSGVAAGEGAPGDILRSDERLVVACGAGAVDLETLQRAGKGPQSASEFLRGFPLAPGDRLI